MENKGLNTDIHMDDKLDFHRFLILIPSSVSRVWMEDITLSVFSFPSSGNGKQGTEN
jgi:hypothetical protein